MELCFEGNLEPTLNIQLLYYLNVRVKSKIFLYVNSQRIPNPKTPFTTSLDKILKQIPENEFRVLPMTLKYNIE